MDLHNFRSFEFHMIIHTHAAERACTFNGWPIRTHPFANIPRADVLCEKITPRFDWRWCLSGSDSERLPRLQNVWTAVVGEDCSLLLGWELSITPSRLVLSLTCHTLYSFVTFFYRGRANWCQWQSTGIGKVTSLWSLCKVAVRRLLAPQTALRAAVHAVQIFSFYFRIRSEHSKYTKICTVQKFLTIW